MVMVADRRFPSLARTVTRTVPLPLPLVGNRENQLSLSEVLHSHPLWVAETVTL
jgi:hypothetical protein